MLAKDLIRKHEGLRLKPYHCPAGKLTIAYGRNLEDKGISEREAEDMLTNDVIEAMEFLKINVRGYYHLNETRQAVLISMYHNLGPSGFLTFKKMLSAVADGDFLQAALEILNSKAARQLPDRYKELADLMRRGK